MKNIPRQIDNDHLKSSDSKLSQSGVNNSYSYYVYFLLFSVANVALRSIASIDCRKVRTR